MKEKIYHFVDTLTLFCAIASVLCLCITESPVVGIVTVAVGLATLLPLAREDEEQGEQ